MQEKFNDLKAAHAPSEGNCDKEFVTSRYWFNCSKMRADLQNIKIQGEAASVDINAAFDVPEMLKSIYEEGGYLSSKIFNID